jgi:hypothetical protein
MASPALTDKEAGPADFEAVAHPAARLRVSPIDRPFRSIVSMEST